MIVGAAGGDDCSPQHIYWTHDNGQTWRDITPSDMPTRTVGLVFFLNPSHGWMLSSDALGDQGNARFYLLSTEDGGKYWRTLMLTRPMFQLMDDYCFPMQVFFSDPEHGWILWRWAMMNSSQHALLATSDGGRTWRRLEDPPGDGPIQFISAQDGWMIGGPEESEDAGIPENTHFWATHDGGDSWAPVPIAIPLVEGSPWGEPYFTVFRFRDKHKGTIVAEQQLEGHIFRVFTCKTLNGGKSWHFYSFDAYHADPHFGSKHILWSVMQRFERDRHGVMLDRWTFQRDNKPVPFVLPAGVSLNSRLVDLDFVDDSNGWATFTDGGQTRLVATSNGGKTSKLMSPPVTGEHLRLH